MGPPLIKLGHFAWGALFGGTVAGVSGFAAGGGVEGASRIVKWAVVGGVAYAVYRSGAIKALVPKG